MDHGVYYRLPQDAAANKVDLFRRVEILTSV